MVGGCDSPRTPWRPRRAEIDLLGEWFGKGSDCPLHNQRIRCGVSCAGSSGNVRMVLGRICGGCHDSDHGRVSVGRINHFRNIACPCALGRRHGASRRRTRSGMQLRQRQLQTLLQHVLFDEASPGLERKKQGYRGLHGWWFEARQEAEPVTVRLLIRPLCIAPGWHLGAGTGAAEWALTREHGATH